MPRPTTSHQQYLLAQQTDDGNRSNSESAASNQTVQNLSDDATEVSTPFPCEILAAGNSYMLRDDDLGTTDPHSDRPSRIHEGYTCVGSRSNPHHIPPSA